MSKWSLFYVVGFFLFFSVFLFLTGMQYDFMWNPHWTQHPALSLKVQAFLKLHRISGNDSSDWYYLGNRTKISKPCLCVCHFQPIWSNAHGFRLSDLSSLFCYNYMRTCHVFSIVLLSLLCTKFWSVVLAGMAAVDPLVLISHHACIFFPYSLQQNDVCLVSQVWLWVLLYLWSGMDKQESNLFLPALGWSEHLAQSEWRWWFWWFWWRIWASSTNAVLGTVAGF